MKSCDIHLGPIPQWVPKTLFSIMGLKIILLELLPQNLWANDLKQPNLIGHTINPIYCGHASVVYCSRSYDIVLYVMSGAYPISNELSIGLILSFHPANERRCYFLTSLIGWAQTSNLPCSSVNVYMYNRTRVQTTNKLKTTSFHWGHFPRTYAQCRFCPNVCWNEKHPIPTNAKRYSQTMYYIWYTSMVHPGIQWPCGM